MQCVLYSSIWDKIAAQKTQKNENAMDFKIGHVNEP
jgi:hypothetical protein